MTGDNKRKPLYERLKTGLEEGVQYARGKLMLRSTVLAAPPPRMNAEAIVTLRRRFGMSQLAFARALNVPLKTLQSWEQGIRSPSKAALRLLQLAVRKPETLREAIGAD